MAVFVFLPAWTLRWWQAWLFLAVFAAAVLAITLHFLARDPALIERRLKAGPAAETEPSQRIIQIFASLAFVLLSSSSPVSTGISARSASRPPCRSPATLLVLAGLLVVFLVFRENSYTAGTVEVASGQALVATGPYALVRHPMYAGAIVMLLGVPLALGSAWALVPFAALAGLIVVRLLDEERLLVARLPGYAAYRERTPARLIPHVW